MSLLVNGVNVSRYLSTDAAQRGAQLVAGGLRRTDGGSLRRDVIARKEPAKFDTKPMLVSDAAVLRAWIQGAGDVMNFESAWTAKGVLFVNNDSEQYVAGRYGSALTFPSADSGYVLEFDLASLVGTPTVWGWRNGTEHWIRRYLDNACWLNGVSTPLASWPTDVAVDVSFGGIQFNGAAPSTFDDWVAFPLAIPDAWAAEIYAEHSARAWSTLPRLRVTGDVLPDMPRTMRGQDLGGSLFATAAGIRERVHFVLEDI